ncbi:glucoamylase [Aspergillus udagawae]|uniref:Glucoamylase n=1 Tax=Aspergillus udagawae TaxID=91492 RepID=A0A8H3N2T2_9EURO|nr:glucoamylase [Aspergillus udagawae]
MRFSSISVGIASVLGHLATASPANELAERSSAAANSYLVKEGLFSYESILKALGNTGSNAPGTAAGLLIASPNTENPDYFFTWTRDAALTFKGLVDIFVEGNKFLGVNFDTLEKHIQDYISSQAVLQNVSNPSGRLSDGSGLGEPKFEVNFNPYSGGWGRPQRDGPALRAIAMLTYMRHLIQQGKKSVASNLIWPVVANDLAYVAQYWNHTGFDLWEEVDGSSFFTTAVQHRAMVEGSAVAQALGKPHAAYDSVAPQILCFLQSYWNGSAIVSNINVNKGRSGIDLNSVLTSIHSFDPAAGCDDSTFQPCSSKALANHKVYVDAFRSIYRINAGRGPGKAANVGRYPEDVYQGGNPWYLATLAAAEQLYDALYQWQKQGYLTVTQTSLTFFRDFSSTVKPGTYKSNDPTYKSLTEYIRTYADNFVFLVEQYTPSNGSLAEQYDRNTGAPLSANDLTWSFAAFLSALQRRLSIMPGSWGSSSANTVPTACSTTTVTGTYSAVAPPFPTSTAHCVTAVTVPVTFWLTESTYWGENVYMTGNVSALGNWNTSAGYSLNAGLYTSNENLWFATVKGLAPGVIIEYKFYKTEPDNSVTWEGGSNRVYTVPAGCPVAPQVHAVWQS